MPYPLSGVTDVATAGAAVQISNTPRRVLSITFVNPVANTSTVYVGNDGAGDVSSTTGVPIERGKSATWNFGVYDISVPISDFWIDVAVNGEDVAWFAVMFT